MKLSFNPESKAAGFDFLIAGYFQAGFGSLTKSDIDLLFFALINKYANLEDKSDYALSKLLQISQSRVRNLKIKNGLKFEPLSLEDTEDAFLEKAKFARVEEDGKRISIPIYDPNLYIELEYLIEKDNGYVEAHLNPKIFTIRIDQFIGLLVNIQAEKEGKTTNAIKKEYLSLVKSKLGQEEKYAKTIDPEAIVDFKDLQKLIFEKGVSFGLDLLASSIPGGTFATKLVKVLYTSVKDATASKGK